jgi:hypothetical protein
VWQRRNNEDEVRGSAVIFTEARILETDPQGIRYVLDGHVGNDGGAPPPSSRNQTDGDAKQRQYVRRRACRRHVRFGEYASSLVAVAANPEPEALAAVLGACSTTQA